MKDTSPTFRHRIGSLRSFDGGNDGRIEMDDGARFMSVTGWRLTNYLKIASRQAELERWSRGVFEEQGVSRTWRNLDANIFLRAGEARFGKGFLRLFSGNKPGNPSDLDYSHFTSIVNGINRKIPP